MYEAINHGNKIGVAIAEELASCYKKIKYLLRQVLLDIKQAKKTILRHQRQTIRIVKNLFIRTREDLTGFYLSETASLRH